MSEPIRRFETLTCACGSQRFYEVFQLKRHPQGGMSRDAQSHVCAACHQVADTGKMVRVLELQRQRQTLQDLDRELTEQSPAVPTGQ